jgi:hypothetical protein
VKVDQGPLSLAGGNELYDDQDVASYSPLFFLGELHVPVAEEKVILDVFFISTY